MRGSRAEHSRRGELAVIQKKQGAVPSSTKCKTASPSDESSVFSPLGLAVPNDECEVPHYPALNPKGNEGEEKKKKKILGR